MKTTDEFDGTIPEDANEIRDWAQVIYNTYPNKVNRVSAIREIMHLLESGEVGPTALLAATERYAQKWEGTNRADRRAIYHPTIWYRTRAFKPYLPEPA